VQLANKCERPKVRLSASVVTAAYRRGISITQIARATGLSHQRIDQKLAKIPRNKAHVHKSSAVRTLTACVVCGAVIEDQVSYAAIRKGYCSSKCWGFAKRCLSDVKIVWAIEQRICSGETWTSLQNALKHPMQVIQGRICQHLHERDLLYENVLALIWRPAAHLQRKFGKWDSILKTRRLTAKVGGPTDRRQVMSAISEDVPAH